MNDHSLDHDDFDPIVAVEITINDGTVLLVAQILRQVLGLKDRSYGEAKAHIHTAVQELRRASDNLKQGNTQ